MPIVRDPAIFYLTAFLIAAVSSFLSCPIFRVIALRFGIIDHPNTAVKTHKAATPYLGGCAIALGFVLSVLITQMMSPYSSRSFSPLYGIFSGGFLILMLGLVDDIVSGGLTFKEKFFIQFIASSVLLFYDIGLKFISPRWVAFGLTMFWVTGVMNAINIIDIMDGLASGLAAVAALAFLFISLPTEQVYVNLVSAALAGACIGFMPFNFSKKWKMFMGDTGSLLIGYVLATLSLGTEYTTLHNAGVFAPVLILGVPLYDTFFVMLIRYRKGLSPFLGSKDHFALRLEKLGLPRHKILWIALGISVILSYCAWLTTRIWFWWAVGLYGLIVLTAILVGVWLSRIKID